MQSAVFDKAGDWVRQQLDFSISDAVSSAEISSSLASIHSLIARAGCCLMVPDLFPDSDLEVLYVPADEFGVSGASSARAFSSPAHVGAVTLRALRAIGKVLDGELVRTGLDLVACELDDGAKAFAYRPAARDAVLKASGVALVAG